jgi:membrane protein implicated in regulation of membrane protease activity
LKHSDGWQLNYRLLLLLPVALVLFLLLLLLPVMLVLFWLLLLLPVALLLLRLLLLLLPVERASLIVWQLTVLLLLLLLWPDARRINCCSCYLQLLLHSDGESVIERVVAAAVCF